MIDQVISSTVNFSLTAIAVRALAFDDFSRFTVVWLYTLMAQGLQAAISALPMMTEITRQSEAERTTWAAAYSLFNALTGMLFACGLCVLTTLLLHGLTVTQTLSIWLFSYLFLEWEFIRRLFVATNNYKMLVVLGAVGAVSRLLSAIAAMRLISDPGMGILVGAIGVGYLPCVIPAWSSTMRCASRPKLRVVAYYNWHSGRWLVPMMFLNWLQINGSFLGMSQIFGNALVGQARLGQSLVSLANPMIQLIEAVLPVKLTKISMVHGHDAAKRYTLKLLVTMLLLAALGFVPFLDFMRVLGKFAFGDAHEYGKSALPAFYFIVVMNAGFLIARALHRALLENYTLAQLQFLGLATTAAGCLVAWLFQRQDDVFVAVCAGTAVPVALAAMRILRSLTPAQGRRGGLAG